MFPHIAVYKIGCNKGRPRIWIDGKRLADAGFVGGTIYRCGVLPGVIQLSLNPMPDEHTRKVTGRPDGKPIIDMLGRDVAAAFPGASHVAVTFSAGQIIIRATAKE